jgi:fibronectin type 3 domain-containing protein
MGSLMMQLPKILPASVITICVGLIYATPAIPSFSSLGQEVAQPASPPSPDAKPKSHSVNLSWKASTSIVAGYNVYRAEKTEGPFTKLNSSPIVKTNYEDTGVRAGHTYYYKVAAVDAKGKESESTTQIQAVVPSP